MQDSIHKARKGNQEAVLSLYDESKRTVLSLCRTLLLTEKEADHAATLIFKKVFEELLSGRIESEEEFKNLAIRKTILHCKMISSKKSNRSFRIPANSNFAATSYDPSRMDFSGDMQQIILKNLPTLYRYIYVLHTVCDYTAEEISKIFSTNLRAVENALEAERTNIEKIVAIARRKRNDLFDCSKGEFQENLIQDAETIDVPASTDETVQRMADTLCEPIRRERSKNRNIFLGTAGILAIVIMALLIFLPKGGDSTVDLENADPDSTAESSTETVVDTSSESDADIVASYYADIEIQDYGTITVALNAEAAPETVENFVSLAQEGFYDGLTFHRIMDGFMMQGGDPNGDGTGGNTDADGNEINITGEFSANGFDNPLSHTAGAISMARANDYDSGSSQFFIVHTSDYISSLDGNYACFGYVTEGMEIVDAICTEAEPTDDNGTIPADEQPVITSITIREAEADEDTDEIQDAESSESTDGTNSTDTVENESEATESTDENSAEGTTDEADNTDSDE